MFFKHVSEQDDANVCVFKQNFNESEHCDIEWYFFVLAYRSYSVFAVYLLSILKHNTHKL
jgi:hypothetical protein